MILLKHINALASYWIVLFFFQAEDGIRGTSVTGVQTCALPIFKYPSKDTSSPSLDVIVFLEKLGTLINAILFS